MPAQAMDVVHLLGLGIIRLEVRVADRPRRRDAVIVLDLAKIFFPQPVERRPEQFCRAADEIMHLRLKRPAVAIVPALRRDVAVLHEQGCRVPVLRLALEPIAALENEDALPRRREVSRQRAAARAAANDDDVEALIHLRFTSVGLTACPGHVIALHCWIIYSPTLLCMMPPSVKMVVAVR